MSIQNRFAFMARLIKDRISGKATPLVVVLNTTFRCNLRCGYCYGQYFQRTDEDFTTVELLGLIDDLSKLGTRSITLGGGEPLLRQDIGQIIDRIKQHGIECGMNTNGILIPQRLDMLRKIDMVTISIDGPKELNDRNRGDGSFEKIMAGLEAALAADIKVHTTTVLTKHNYQAIDWIVDMARRKKIQAEFNFLFHQNRGKHESDTFMAEETSLRKAAERIVELKKKGAPILFSKKIYQWVARWPDYKKRIIQQKSRLKTRLCNAGRFMMFIDADGKVYPCVQLIDVFPALEFRSAGIEKAWRHTHIHNCYACYFPCFNEFNAVFNLDPEILLEQIMSTLQNH